MVNARRRVKAIPPAAAKRIAQAYGYDQVIVLVRRLDASGEEGEHVTAWGPNEAATPSVWASWHGTYDLYAYADNQTLVGEASNDAFYFRTTAGGRAIYEGGPIRSTTSTSTPPASSGSSSTTSGRKALATCLCHSRARTYLYPSATMIPSSSSRNLSETYRATTSCLSDHRPCRGTVPRHRFLSELGRDARIRFA